jgi:hypothetical protein
MCIVAEMFSSWQLADMQATEVVLSNVFLSVLQLA